MEFKYPEAIVECDWLLKQLNDDNVRIYDCTTILHYTDDHPDKPYAVSYTHLTLPTILLV